MYEGDQLTITAQTDIDLAGQPDTRQSTSSYILSINGIIFHWRAHTEKVIIRTTAAGEYIALSRGNEACKFVREILKYFGNTQHVYHLYTYNQAAEHLATQPNMNDHSRSIDIKHHGIKQDYLQDNMRIGGVASLDNTSDILTKNLQPPLHAKHCAQLHILTPVITNHTNLLTNNVVSIKPKNERPKPHHGHTRTKATEPTPSVSHIDTYTTSKRATKRQRQKKRQQHWDSIIAERKLCRQLGIKHNELPQHTPTTTLHKNLSHIPQRSEFARRTHSNRRPNLPKRVETTTMKLQTRPRATRGNSLNCPKPPQGSFNIDQSHSGDVRTSKIYRSNQKLGKLHAYPGKLQTYPEKLQTYPGKLHNSAKFHNFMKPRLLHPIA